MIFLFPSLQQYKFLCIPKCSKCGKYSWAIKFTKGDGFNISREEIHKIARSTRIKLLGTIISKQNTDDIRAEALSIMAQCLNCENTWPYFSGAAVPRSEGEFRIIEVIETHQSQEEFRTEQQRIDNSKSSIEMERRITISQEWSKSVVIEKEDAKKAGAEINIGVNEAANFKATAEQAIKSKYTVSEDTKRTFSESILLKVPGKTNTLLTLIWKRNWQHGIIRIVDQNGAFHEIPFKTIVGLSFDQTQVDEP